MFLKAEYEPNFSDACPDVDAGAGTPSRVQISGGNFVTIEWLDKD
jgi:hypothetical protein